MIPVKPGTRSLQIPALLALLLCLWMWSTANAQDTSPPDASAEISRIAEGTTPGQGEGTSDPQEEQEVLPPPDPTAPPMMTPTKSPPAYDEKKYDWIRLTSGEWLKGDVLSMRDGEFEFDSDEMDKQSFDWEDIAELRSSRQYTYVLIDRTTLIGTALIIDQDVLISVGGEEQVLKRNQLMSIVPAGTRERDRWDGTLSLGMAFRRGNTNQTDFTYQSYIQRTDAITRVRLDFNGAIGEVEGEQTLNNHRSNLKVDLFATPRFYITPLAFNVYHDKFQNIDIQAAPSAGIGYHAV